MVERLHVRKRLERYRAGHHMSFDEIDPDNLAMSSAKAIAQGADYWEVETNGATNAATIIAQLI